MMTETTITVSPTEGAPQVKSDPGQVQTIRVNIDYFKTVPGILKIVQIVIGIVCMATASPARLSATSWFLFVVVISFIETLVWIIIYLLSIKEALKFPINWPLTELVQSAITTILYVTAFIPQLATWATYNPYLSNNPFFRSPAVDAIRDANLTAGCFGLFNTLVYGYEAYLLYSMWKATRPQPN